MSDGVIGFAHRGAKAYARENTLEAFSLALRLGASGLESDVWLTSDGIPVLDHDGIVKGRLRSRAIRDVECAQLPDHIPTLAEFLDQTPVEVPVSLDVKDEAAFGPVVDSFVGHARGSTLGLYLCHPHVEVLISQAHAVGQAELVHSTRLARMKEGPERHAAVLREAGIHVVNMPYPDWSGGLVALFRRFGVKCFAWDCQHERQISEVARMGIDGVYSDWPDRLADILRTEGR